AATTAETTPPPLESTIDASAGSAATAVGISADGLASETSQRLQLQIGGGPSFIAFDKSSTHASGKDDVTNSGTISAAATAISHAIDFSVTQDGKAAVKAESTADASAAGIDLGGGNDTLKNTAGTVTATADATARALSLAIGLKSDSTAKSTAESAVEASVKAEATAIGISADALQIDSTL